MAKKKSLKGKGTYAVYRAESRAETNRKARIERHLKKHPNDKQSAIAKGKAKSPKQNPSTKLGQPAKRVEYRDKAGNLMERPSFAPLPKTRK